MVRLKSGGLAVSLDELRKLVEHVECAIKFNSMKGYVEIEVENGKVEIKQYCHYAECNPIRHSSYTTPEKEG